MYGSARKKTLQIIEEGRKEEKERRRAERDAIIAAEKLTASEKDVAEIVALFGFEDTERYQPTPHSIQSSQRYLGKPLNFDTIWKDDSMKDFEKATNAMINTENVKIQEQDVDNFVNFGETDKVFDDEYNVK